MELLQQIRDAVRNYRAIHISHTKATGEISERTVLPYFVVRDKRGRQYVHAYCQLRHKKRCFRLDRINSVETGMQVVPVATYKKYGKGLTQEPVGIVLSNVWTVE